METLIPSKILIAHTVYDFGAVSGNVLVSTYDCVRYRDEDAR